MITVAGVERALKGCGVRATSDEAVNLWAKVERLEPLDAVGRFPPE
jgi:hypothetical protein